MSKAETVPRVLANWKPVRFGQVKFAKGTQVMRLCVQWRQLHEPRVLQEPREVNSLNVMLQKIVTPSERRTYGKVN